MAGKNRDLSHDRDGAQQGAKGCDSFTQLYEGDGLEIMPESKEFNFKCCTCGLVHRVEIEHTDNSVILRFRETHSNGD